MEKDKSTVLNYQQLLSKLKDTSRKVIFKNVGKCNVCDKNVAS